MIDDTLADRIVDNLQRYQPFHSLVLKKRPLDTLWNAYNDTLLRLRGAIYHVRLGKKPPKPADRHAAVQMGLALLGAFSQAVGVNQAIVSSERGLPRSISFQPRPNTLNWTAEHALTCQHDQPLPTSAVEMSDFLFLAVKTICAVAYYQMGHMRDGTSTFNFIQPRSDIPDELKGYPAALVTLIVREKHGRSYDAYIQT